MHVFSSVAVFFLQYWNLNMELMQFMFNSTSLKIFFSTNFQPRTRMILTDAPQVLLTILNTHLSSVSANLLPPPPPLLASPLIRSLAHPSAAQISVDTAYEGPPHRVYIINAVLTIAKLYLFMYLHRRAL